MGITTLEVDFSLVHEHNIINETIYTLMKYRKNIINF